MTTGTQDKTYEQALAVGKQLVELCNAGRGMQVIETYYSDDIVSLEVCGMPDEGMPREMKGIEAIKAKNKWWYDNHEVHSSTCTGPHANGDQFIVNFAMDVTPKMGPMAGQRMQMQEAGLYTVKDGKIVREQFFYDMSGCE